jgi:PhzF family phenazine biosynthesis protein
MLIACIDAFTDRPFRGNPAGVCLLDAARDDAWMQQVAAEMNLAETAFVSPGAGVWPLKWFTPTVEMALCGHATLATAHLLWNEGRVPPGHAIRFETRSGTLTATRGGDLIELDFPSEPAVEQPAPLWLAEALGESPVWCGRNRLDYIVELEDASAVRRLRPDLAALAASDQRGVIVTSRSDDPAFDFVSRFFAPAVGIPEDPVTGSAHCCLGPFWGPRLGKIAMVGYQASPRGGVVRVTLAGHRIVLGGQAVTVHRGSLYC